MSGKSIIYKLADAVILRQTASISHSSPSKAIASLTHPPRWALDLVGQSTETLVDGARISESADFCLVSLSVGNADAMDGPALEQAAAEGYRRLCSCMRRATIWHPLRIWNFVPRILSDGGDGLDRYMRFNAGRYRAFTEWLGGAQGFSHLLPAASAVGHHGPDLVICALGARHPGRSIANPRQINPHQYSKRFGPFPPCFARATQVNALGMGGLLLVGGTSSVRGEESVHVGNLRLQLAETLENLAALVRKAFGPVSEPLAHYRALRIYHLRKSDLAVLQADIHSAFPSIAEIEWQQAELCRDDLLVEIEGLAGTL